MKPFPCGHPRSAENSYFHTAKNGGIYSRCKQCVREKDRQRSRDYQREYKEKTKRARVMNKCALAEVWRGV